ncbi:hypothetical protein AXF42_Ash006787 [Apostasia shenzhenica]|uniref:DUF642 domain-containing protein n=1 Tax=Apostasia shenzhenica TaxID=1088818 RepID=A0A2I0AJ79_9ASPA|nr:hypothetical protein AXF42_Ash006787 [Apostasia shenzhenica]
MARRVGALLYLLILLALSHRGSPAVEDDGLDDAGLMGLHGADLPAGLLENGDFETIPPGGYRSAGTGEGATVIPGWVVNGTVEVVRSGQRQGGMILIVPQGEHAVRLGNEAGVSQSVAVEKGSTYAVTFSAARTCAQLESLNVSVAGVASQTIDLQTLYSVEGWDAYAWAFLAGSASGGGGGDGGGDGEMAKLVFINPGMEEDPTCGPIIDNIAIKKLFTPDRPEENAVLNGDFEEGPWTFKNASLGILLPTNLDEETSSLPGWIVESNRAVRYIDSDHFIVPQGKRAVELLSGKEGIISQMVETKPDKQYNLIFTMGSAGDLCQPPLAVMAFAGDQAQNFHFSPIGNSTSMSANLSFTAKAERTRVAFYSVYYNTRSDDHSSLCGPVVDDVKVWGASGAASAAQGLAAVAMWMVMVDEAYSGGFCPSAASSDNSCQSTRRKYSSISGDGEPSCRDAAGALRLGVGLHSFLLCHLRAVMFHLRLLVSG